MPWPTQSPGAPSGGGQVDPVPAPARAEPTAQNRQWLEGVLRGVEGRATAVDLAAVVERQTGELALADLVLGPPVSQDMAHDFGHVGRTGGAGTR